MKKWTRRGLILLVALSLVWWTGVVQEWVVEWGAGQFGGVVIEVDGGHYLTGLGFDSITVYPDQYAKSQDSTFVEFQDIRIERTGVKERRIRRVSIGKLNVHVEENPDGEWNHQFLLDMLNADTKASDDTWLPIYIDIDEITVSGRSGERNFQLDNLGMKAALESSAQMSVHFEGNHVSSDVTVEGNDGFELGFRSIRTDVDVYTNVGELQIQATLNEHGFWNAIIVVYLSWQDEGVVLKTKALRVELLEQGFERVQTALFPEEEISLKRLQLVVDSLSWNLEEDRYPWAALSVEMERTRIGDSESPLFSGDVLARYFQIQGGETMSAEGMVDLGYELTCSVSGNFGEDGERINIRFKDWEKSALAGIGPQDFRNEIEELAFDRLSGNVEIELADSRFAVDSDVRSTSTSGDSPIDLQVSLEGETGKIAGTTGSLALTLGDGKVTGDGRMTVDGDYEADLKLESMPLRPFALLAAGTRLPEEVSGTLDGTVTMRQAADSVEAVVTPTVVLSKVVYEEKEQPDFALGGLIQVDTEIRVATSDAITVTTDYDEVSLSLSGVEYDLNTGALASEVEYTFDVGWVDALGDLGGAYGMLKGTGTLSSSEGVYLMPFMAESNDLGYGDALSLYDIPFTANGTLQYLEENGRFDLLETHMTLGEGTSVDIAQASYLDGVLRGEAVGKSDLDLLVKMAYTELVDADVKGIATWVIDEEDAQIDWSTSGTVEKLMLLEKAGTVENVTYELAGDYGEVLSGEGILSVVALSSMGATIHGVNASLGFEENVLVISNARSEVFDGTLESRVAIAVLEDGIPVRYEGEFASVDLARLTEEVQPPKTTMTGIASGDVEADYSITDGLVAFELDVQSHEGFTINRSLVEEMMQMQTVLKGLGEKKAEKTMAKFLGENPQRPFDTARMTVFLWEGVIEGVSELKSAKTRDYNGLNLTIQLSIDQPALVQSLKMLEDSGGTAFEF